MSAVFDFKSIRSKLERQEQKADFEAKNPPAMKVVWSPEWGYGVPCPYGEAMYQAMLLEAYKRAHPIVFVGDLE
jgi:hypothetical protein